MHDVSRKYVERNLRAKEEASSNFKKSFFDISYRILTASGYDFLRIDKNRFLLPYNHFQVSYDGLNCIQSLLRLYWTLPIYIMYLENT